MHFLLNATKVHQHFLPRLYTFSYPYETPTLLLTISLLHLSSSSSHEVIALEQNAPHSQPASFSDTHWYIHTYILPHPHCQLYDARVWTQTLYKACLCRFGAIYYVFKHEYALQRLSKFPYIKWQRWDMDVKIGLQQSLSLVYIYFLADFTAIFWWKTW